MTFYRHFILTKGRSHGFASAARYYGRPVRTCFRYGFVSEKLILASYEQLVGSLSKRHAVSPLVSEETRLPTTVCKHAVSGTISLPSEGFFSPFPHGTGSLSVTREYLALRDGSRRFTQNFTYSVLLGILSRVITLLLTGLSPSMVSLSRKFS